MSGHQEVDEVLNSIVLCAHASCPNCPFLYGYIAAKERTSAAAQTTAWYAVETHRGPENSEQDPNWKVYPEWSLDVSDYEWLQSSPWKVAQYANASSIQYRCPLG